MVKSLLERRLVRIVGHREVPGRPMLYSTSKRFLEVFGLKSLKDLPALRELDELAKEHGLARDDEGETGEPGGDADAPITELAEGEALSAEEVAKDLGVREVDAEALKPAPEPRPEQVVDLEAASASAGEADADVATSVEADSAESDADVVESDADSVESETDETLPS